MKVYNKRYECYGCGKCKVICPVNAIHMEKDEDGFLYPVIDDDICIKCGKCTAECINYTKISTAQGKEPKQVLACTAKDEQVLARSTSGGIFWCLAEKILANHGVVYGAAYSDGRVAHLRVDEIIELPKLQGTKYVQSDITDALIQVGKDIKEGKKILFTGTPCQVAAVRSLYEKNSEQLLLVEVVCMGCPSPEVFESYLKEKTADWGKIEQINCRDKVTGWRSSSITYEFEKEKQSFRHSMDIYMLGFKQALYMRPSCHECSFKGEHTGGDLKIGDFWGIDNYSEFYKSKDGVSLVVVETEQGKKWIEQIEEGIAKEEMDYKYALVYNPYMELSRKASKNRAEFFEEFRQKEQRTSEVIKKYLVPQFGEKDRFWLQYPIAEGMLQMSLNGKSTADFFRKNQYKKIAIYGLGKLGKMLVQDLEGTDIEIQCLIDRNYARFPEQYKGIKVIGPHQLQNEQVDCVVVSLVHLYNSILEVLLLQGIELDKIISIGSIV